MVTPEIISSELERLSTVNIDTYRGLNAYQHLTGMDDAEYIQLLTERKILDVCAGYCGFALESHMLGVNRKVVSIVPGGNHARFYKYMASFFRTNNQPLISTQKEAYSVINQVRPRIITCHPADTGLPSSSFDVIYDAYGFNYYSHKMPDDLYQQSLLEVLRLLSPKGLFFIRAHNLARAVRTNQYFDKLCQTFKDVCDNTGHGYQLVEGQPYTIVVTAEE